MVTRATVAVSKLTGPNMNALTTLLTPTPEDGFALAIKLARLAVKYTQPDDAVRMRVRKDYAEDAQFLIAASQVVATNFHTIAQANGYWLQSA